MIKIDIQNRQNLTMLAKAYWDRLLPRPRNLEAFSSNDKDNEVRFIYFKNHEYYYNLLHYIQENQANFINSNAEYQWTALFRALSIKTVVDKVDYADLEHYSLTDDNQDVERELDTSILLNTTFIDTLLRDVKRIYKDYYVTYRGSQNFIVILLPYKPSTEFSFDINPIIRLTQLHNKNLEKLLICWNSVTSCSEVRIAVK